jgi:hypothetical protein
MSFQPWYYFLSLERDFTKTEDFVHVHPDNEDTYSNEFAKLLLLIGSEVDVVAKMVCAKVAPSAKAENINDYRQIIVSAFPGMHAIEIDPAKYGLKIQPWLSWDPAVAKSPAWWTAYNNVKHGRDKNFSEANQKNTLHALCGLMALLLYYYKDEAHLQPYPVLLDHGFPSHLVTEGGKKLPGT